MSTDETQEETVGRDDAPVPVATTKASKTEGFMAHREDLPTSASIAERKKLRSEMESEVDKFLRAGGKINEVEANVMADPPKKPESNYGSRPI